MLTECLILKCYKSTKNKRTRVSEFGKGSRIGWALPAPQKFTE